LYRKLGGPHGRSGWVQKIFFTSQVLNPCKFRVGQYFIKKTGSGNKKKDE
jgi:hypothetical protein